jgi:hypothetical protein
MALRGTLTHWKTRLLADQLGISPAHALGLLEALWHVTAEDAPSGNIGRLSNKAIAMQMFTDLDPDRLIDALIASRHLDVHPVHRLIVHGWSDHADNHIHAWLARRCLRFADGSIPNSGQLNHYEREQFYAWLEDEGEPKPRTGRPKSTTKTQGKVSVNSGESHVPEPEPEPLKPSANSSDKTEIDGGEDIPSKGKPSKGIKKPRKRKSSKAEELEPPNPKHMPIRAMFNAYYVEKNGRPAPWGGREAKRLDEFLKENPDITVQDFETILDNRARSPVTHAYPLSKWMNIALSWLNGLADDWGHTITGGKPNGRSTAQSKQDRTIAAINEAIASVQEVDHGRIREDRDSDGRGSHEGAPVADSRRTG